VLRQRLRPDAAPTLAYLTGQGIAVKVFSGDNAAAVGAVAAAAGVPGAGDPVDARDLTDEAGRLAGALDGHSVFGRVTPQQKRTFVRTLRARGHTVAMTGDGVNDVLALKDADLGVAMGSGSPASRAVATVVLLDDSFATLPRVLAQGRQVLGNVERVAHLFLIKTTYAVVLALLIGVAHVPFPFLPRHVTLVGSLTIGIPGFVLALAPNAERFRPGFVRRVLRLAVPAGLVCAGAAFVTYWLARTDGGSSLVADRSAATLTLFLAAAAALAMVARPYRPWRAGLVAATVAAFAVVAAVPFTREFFALDYSDWGDDLLAAGIGALAGLALFAVSRAAGRRG
jgi:cation-transporting ATPase E